VWSLRLRIAKAFADPGHVLLMAVFVRDDLIDTLHMFESPHSRKPQGDHRETTGRPQGHQPQGGGPSPFWGGDGGAGDGHPYIASWK
jgi:hypothetical protein